MKKTLYISIALMTLVGFIFINAEKADAYAPCWEQQLSPGNACHATVDSLTADWLDANQTRLQISVSASFAAGGSTGITGVSDLSIIGQYQPYYSSFTLGGRFDKTYPIIGYYDLSSVPNGTTFHITFNVVSEFGGNPGPSSDSKTRTITIMRSPTCSLSFSPLTITRGESTTAYWTSTNDADNSLSYSCTGDIGSGSLTPANSNTPIAPTQSQTCTLTAINSAGVSKTCSASVTVNAPPTSAPTATLTANPTTVAPGGVPIMSWSSTNAANCSVLAGAGFKTGGAVQGSCNTTPGAGCPSPLAGTTTFSIRCYEFADKTGRTADAAATVTVVSLNAGAVGECQQNYPSSAVQSYISWNAVPGATSYTVKESRFLFDRTVGTTSVTSIIDRNVSFGSSYNYYVIAYDGSGKEITRSDTTSAMTPASCSGAPACNVAGTNVITPPQQSTNVGSTASFVSLYDPDGGGAGRYGNFDVSTSASWLSDKPLIASSQGNGVFKGESAGTAPIHSTFCSVLANASLDVNNPAQPDFSIAIVPATPQYQTVTKPGTTTYAVAVSPSGGFSGNIVLLIGNTKPLHAGTTGNFSPASINTSGNSTLTLSVNASAAVEIYTFAVVGTSGSINHSASADLNVTTPPVALSCSVTPNPQSGSAPLTTSVSASGSGGTSPYQYRYDWTSDGSYDTNYVLSPQNYTYNSDGTYKITVRAKDANNTTALCDTSVNLPPNVCVGASCGGVGSLSCTLDAAPKFGPAPLNVAFQISNVSGGSGNYQYSFDYGDSQSAPYPAANPSSHTYNNQGSYTATGSVKDDAGKSGSCSKDITGNDIIIWVNPPTPSGCTFTATPSSVLYGQSSTLSWSCTPTDTSRNCTIKDDAGKTITTGIQSGTKTVKPLHDTTYTLSCTGAPTVDNSTASVKVGFIPVIREIIPR